jgi:hypothetical protein
VSQKSKVMAVKVVGLKVGSNGKGGWQGLLVGG